MNTVIPDDSLVKVPRLYHYDKEEHVLIVEDCGADTQTLKQLLKDGSLDLQACRTIGRALGTFLATVHRECSKDQKLLQYFHNSTKMKGSCAPLTRVVSTLTGERKTRTGEAVVDPPLENSLPEGTIQKVERIVQEMTLAIGGTTVKRFFTMGDFQTQNVIIKTCGGATGTPKVERVFVIDWEDTKPGQPYMDFGHFVAEMHSLRRFYEGTAKETVDETLKEYFTAYKKGYQVDEVFLRGAIAQVGAHLIESTPVMGWEPKEKVRAVIAEGVEYLAMSRQRKPDLIKKTAIINLVGENEEVRVAAMQRLGVDET